MVQRPPEERWRRTGLFNVALVSCALAILLIFLAVNLSQAGGGIVTATLLYEGPCDKARAINIFIHLVINLISSGILASSNYFMQILSAPSRDEVDRAHKRLVSLDIGIPSAKNIFHVSNFKRISYFILFLSSVPIHLFFNSSVFETDYQGSDWNLTIATEAFTNNGPAQAPGASLTIPGLPIPMSRYLPNQSFANFAPVASQISDEACGSMTQGACAARGFGKPGFNSTGWYDLGAWSEYLGDIKANLTDPDPEDSEWVRLEATPCLEEYKFCNPRRKFQDVVVIVESTSSNGQGWVPQDIFQSFPDNSTDTWNDSQLLGKLNTLWFSASCHVNRGGNMYIGIEHCANSCTRALGHKECGWPDGVIGSRCAVSVLDTSDEYTKNKAIPIQDLRQEFSPGSTNPLIFDSLPVKYCWSRVPPRNCKVKVSNPMILVVVGCFMVKIAQCCLVVWGLPTLSIVTPGDAVQSFIRSPDPNTFGLSTLELKDSIRLEHGPRRYSSDMTFEIQTGLVSRRLPYRTHKLRSSFPGSVWVHTYGILFIGGGALLAGLAIALDSVPDGFEMSRFGSTDANLLFQMHSQSFLGSLIFCNFPQLLLSFCYFVYNAFFTRLQVEKEWNSYSSSFQPLRVSYPQGQQVSTYRLQLPYRWSLPLIGLSAFLHWLVSNSLFIFVSEGGYWPAGDYSIPLGSSWVGLDENSLIAIGYSPLAIILTTTASFTAMTFPTIFSQRSVKSLMVAGGSDSMVISAACHCYSAILPAKQKIGKKDTSCDAETQEDNESIPYIDGEEAEQLLYDLTLSKVRWGAMKPSQELLRLVTPREGETLMHLGFGGEDAEISDPREDVYYA